METVIPHKVYWNTHHGCRKISPGCARCYMYALDEMRGINIPSDIVRRNSGDFKAPLKKNRQGVYKIRSGERLQVNMTSDTFIEEADEWRDKMWDIIKQRPDVIFWLLTKRPERFSDTLPPDWPDAYPNVSLNITCEDQTRFSQRWPYLEAVPGKHKGLCLAPLLMPINIEPALASGQIEAVCAGGENYTDPRPSDHDWYRYEADLCRQYRINFAWYESGTYISKDGKMQYIPSKKEQSEYAFFAGYNQTYYEIDYGLVDPVTRQPIKPFVPQYNIHHCLYCGNQDVCTGCTACGNCCTIQLVERPDFLKIQQDLINNF